MADFYGKFLSNEFRVTDEEKLKDIANRMVTCFGENVHVVPCGCKEDNEYRFCIGCEDDITGYVTEEIIKKMKDDPDYDYCEDVWENSDGWIKDIQKILPPDEACIVVFIGNEKLRYFEADSVIVTSKNIEYKNLWDIATETACELLGNEQPQDFHASD